MQKVFPQVLVYMIVHTSEIWTPAMKFIIKIKNNSSDVKILRMRRLISELFLVSLTDIAL